MQFITKKVKENDLTSNESMKYRKSHDAVSVVIPVKPDVGLFEVKPSFLFCVSSK